MMRKRAAALAIIALLSVSACSSQQHADGNARGYNDIRCAHYRMDHEGNTRGGGRSVEPGLTGSAMSADCQLEIAALKDKVSAGVTYPVDSMKPVLSGAPQQITDVLHVEWLSIEQEPAPTRHYLVLPAYTFQCWINEARDPEFACTTPISASHKLSTYTGNAVDISGAAMSHLEAVNLSFTGGQKDTHVRLNHVSSETKMTTQQRSAWTLLLVLHTEWERIGIAKVCLGPEARTVPCEIVRARAVRNENYVMARETGGWDTAVNGFRQMIQRPSFPPHSEPPLPLTAVHLDYRGGPLTQSIGEMVTGVSIAWRNTDTSLQRMERGRSQVVGLGSEIRSARDSTAYLSYSKSKAASGVGCLEVLAVGGKIADKPLTGMILKEGCD